MDALDKLLGRLHPKEQALLLLLLQEVKDNELRSTLQIKKLAGGKYFRVRKRSFRIIFHYEDDRVIVDEVRLRNEKTYRDF